MSRSVLVVDDDEAVAWVLRETLFLLGYAVLVAGDPVEGLRLFRAHSPRAVITDNRMCVEGSDLDAGLCLARSIKALSPSTPVVMLTAVPPEGAADVCDAVLVKPAPIHVLATTLSRLGVDPER